VYDDQMGAGSYEKDLRLARLALVGALRRLDGVMALVEKSDIELWPDAAGDVPAWSAEHLALVKAAAAAWADLARRRQDYDSAARTAGQPSRWPHA
jgi:hypothetical protein